MTFWRYYDTICTILITSGMGMLLAGVLLYAPSLLLRHLKELLK